MADQNPDWELGEFRGSDCVIEEVEYTEDIAVGDPLEVTGYNDYGQAKVKTQTAAKNCRYVCPRGQAGASGDIKQVLHRGDIKITASIAIAEGLSIAAKAGEFVLNSTSGSSNCCGFAKSDMGTANDTGVVNFNGGLS